MKILFANKFFYLKGGSEAVMFQERSFMQEQGFGIVDFSMQDNQNLPSEYSEYFIPPVSYRKGPLLSRLKAAASFVHSGEAVNKLLSLVKKTKPDIAHLHNIYHQLTPSIIPALKKEGVKVALTLHDYKLVCPSYLMTSQGKICNACFGNKFYKSFTKNCQNSRLQGALLCAEAYYHLWKHSYDHVDLFLTPSIFLSQLISARIEKKRICLLRNGIDLEYFSPTEEDDGYILFLGRLYDGKGVRTLLQAHAQLPGSPKLIIVGTGPQADEYQAMAGNNVEFAGYCAGEKLMHYLRRASCIVVPSEGYENAPMTVIEGMALGKPIVASRIGGIPEQVEHEKTGLLYEPGQTTELTVALSRLMSDPELRKNMGTAGRNKAEQEFSLRKHNETLLEIYKKILQPEVNCNEG